MIEFQLYRISIGIFYLTSSRNNLTKCSRKIGSKKLNRIHIGKIILWPDVLKLMIILSVMLLPTNLFLLQTNHSNNIVCPTPDKVLSQEEFFIVWGKRQTVNFKIKCVNGNIVRGVKNIHVNIRSLYNKISEVKNFIAQEKPHILGL